MPDIASVPCMMNLHHTNRRNPLVFFERSACYIKYYVYKMMNINPKTKERNKNQVLKEKHSNSDFRGL